MIDNAMARATLLVRIEHQQGGDDTDRNGGSPDIHREAPGKFHLSAGAKHHH